MKTSAIKQFRNKLRRGECALGLWVTLESPSITEIAVALGLDWVVIDAEHGHLDWKEIIEHLRATVRSDTVALVRVAELSVGLIKRALDIGADGVVLPWIESAEQLQQAVEFARYPPEGIRGVGGERATCWGQCLAEHAQEANENVLVVPVVESVKGGENIHQMLQVDGVEVLFFGPGDYSSSAGYVGQWEGPGIAEKILAAKDAIRAAGKHCGLLVTDNENLLQRRDQGFRMLGIGLDTGLLLRSLHESLAAMGQDRQIVADLSADRDRAPSNPLERPPESMRPDRAEVITPVGQGERVEIEPGVVFECLVGSQNKARDLSTGVVTFAPEAELTYHRHGYGEAVTLLSGSAIMEVEGRSYAMGSLDNLVIPSGMSHRVKNISSTEPAVFHIAMATDTPARTPAGMSFPRTEMPEDATGPSGAERVNRCRTAERVAIGPGTGFVNFFNEKLTPGIRMSGGIGFFEPGGRLPAHVHDFDESIAIVGGEATCLVEGREYRLSDNATAMVPRGRVHYFINQTKELMVMIWVYAGGMPERVVVAEACATADRGSWD